MTDRQILHLIFALVSAFAIGVAFAFVDHPQMGLIAAAVVFAAASWELWQGLAHGTFGKPRRRYTWTPDHTDDRDHIYGICTAIAPSSDLEAGFPPAFDQGSLGSCTGNGWAAVMFYMHKKMLNDLTFWSRLFIYYAERLIESTTTQDAGAMIRDGAKALAKWGVCAESLWPYVISRFKQRPATTAWGAATSARITSYQRISGLDGMRACLSEGWPVVFGIRVYESFESDAVAKSGLVPMPKAGEKNLGGHCIVAVGHDDEKQLVKCRNSWGSKWGQRGHFFLPYAYIRKPGYADDMWTVRK